MLEMTKLEVVDFGCRAETKLEKARRLKRFIDLHSPSGQDAMRHNDELTVFAIADGVAIDKNAATAAHSVTRQFVEEVSDSVLLTAEAARDMFTGGLLDQLHKAALLTGATTTLTGLVVTPDNQASYLHLGDSQLVRRRGDVIEALTSEQVIAGHQLLNYLGESRKWQPGEARPPLVLTKEPGTKSESSREAEWGSVALESGDRFMLFTDGVLGDTASERVRPDQWRSYTSCRLGAQAVADLFVLNSTKIDDTTAMVIDIGKQP